MLNLLTILLLKRDAKKVTIFTQDALLWSTVKKITYAYELFIHSAISRLPCKCICYEIKKKQVLSHISTNDEVHYVTIKKIFKKKKYIIYTYIIYTYIHIIMESYGVYFVYVK